MRSRFAAYALGLADYIIHTTDPQGPQWVADEGVWKASITRFHQSTRFLGLRVLETGPDTVRFRAELEQLGQDASFEELSRFVQREGRWLYQGRVDPT